MSRLARIEASLRAAAAAGRDAVDCGGLHAFLHPADDPPLSLAVPDEPGAEPAGGWHAAVARTEAAFAARGRRARIEMVARPGREGLEPALRAAGWTLAHAMPLLTLDPGRLRDPGLPAGVRAVDDERALERLEEALRAQARAYAVPAGEEGRAPAPGARSGEGSGDEALAWLPDLREGIRGGRVRFTALLEGERVTAGATLQRGGDAWELAGVFADPMRRRRGLAGAACGRALARLLAREPGASAWLSAAEGAQGVYRRLGFEPAGEQRNLDGPARS